MGRIPEEELRRIKRETDLASLIRSSGVELSRHGQDLVGLCPFHADREPSLVVSPRKDPPLWHCLGACQVGGTVIDWVMKAEGVSFRQGVELLRNDYRPPEALALDPPRVSRELKLPPVVSPEMSDPELLQAVVGYYHATLVESPEALEYLEERGLRSEEMLAHFRVGFADRTLGYRVPSRQTKNGPELRDRLQGLGILRSTGHEFFRGSIVVPVVDGEGRVVEMYGRRITKGLARRIPVHSYLPGPHRGVFNLAAFASTREVILCEALLDAMTFWVAGYRHVTSSYGTEGFTGDHLEAFEAYGIERVLVAYDRDEAGERAAAKVAERLSEKGIECYRVGFPRGMDANEYALKVQPAAKSLGLLLQNATWMGGAPKASSVSTSLATPAAEPEPAPTPRPTPPEELPPPASPIPPPPPPPLRVEATEDEVVLFVGDRRWRVRGLAKNLTHSLLKVNLLVSRGDAFHVDTFDLYAARQRTVFVKQAAAELGLKEDLVKKDLGKVLLKLEELQDERIRSATEPQEPAPSMSTEERDAALALLRSDDLLGQILGDFDRCGIVGEETNKLVGYLAATSRKLAEPLAVVVQSSSAAGKTSLMEAVLAFVPPEERVQYSAMTGQSLFYMGEKDLAHRVLAIVEEEGAERASYALKLLQSEGELTIASTGKDPQSGRLVTHEYRVEGPVMIFLTTTAVDLDEELVNRCLVLTVDEDRAQTRAIHRRQREKRTLDGLFARAEREAVLAVHRNAQRLVEPLAVVNPYAPRLTFADARTRTRRDHEKYLTLIDTIALLHQHQREVRTDRRRGREVRYVEVELGDVELANRLAAEVLGRSLDELPPQTRRFLERLDEAVVAMCERLEMDRADYLFTARWVRESLDLGASQVKVHLSRLVELEYLVVHRGGRGQTFLYELVYDGEGRDGGLFLPGLLDVEALRSGRTTDDRPAPEEGWPAPKGHRPGGGRPLAGGWPGGGRTLKTALEPLGENDLKPEAPTEPENAHLGDQKAS